MKTIFKKYSAIVFFVCFVIQLSCAQSDSIVKIAAPDVKITDIKKRDHIPAPTGFVNDFEQIFTPAEKNSLDSLVMYIEKETTMEIAVVTLDSTMTNKTDFRNTTLYIGKKWGVGKKGKNNGIVIGLSKSLKMISIQNGYGIEKKISDEQTKEIQDSAIIPQFKQGKFYEGVRQGIIALYNKLK